MVYDRLRAYMDSVIADLGSHVDFDLYETNALRNLWLFDWFNVISLSLYLDLNMSRWNINGQVKFWKWLSLIWSAQDLSDRNIGLLLEVMKLYGCHYPRYWSFMGFLLQFWFGGCWNSIGCLVVCWCLLIFIGYCHVAIISCWFIIHCLMFSRHPKRIWF